MRQALGLLMIVLVAACGSPPSPPSCDGDFRPVNEAKKNAALNAAESAKLCQWGSDHVKAG